MTVKEWAAKLNGREYGNELTREEAEQLEADGLIAAYGASDDLLEFSGAVDDEIGAWNGAKARLYKKQDGGYGVFHEEENTETAEFNACQIGGMETVSAIWCPYNEKNKIWALWHIEPDYIPHEHFDIMENGILFCRGAVFSAKSIKA